LRSLAHGRVRARKEKKEWREEIDQGGERLENTKVAVSNRPFPLKGRRGGGTKGRDGRGSTTGKKGEGLPRIIKGLQESHMQLRFGTSPKRREQRTKGRARKTKLAGFWKHETIN